MGYDTERPNTELYGSPKTSEWGQAVSHQDWNTGQLDYFGEPIPEAYPGFIGVTAYENATNEHTLPYRTAYFGEAPFDLQPFVNKPLPWTQE